MSDVNKNIKKWVGKNDKLPRLHAILLMVGELCDITLC